MRGGGEPIGTWIFIAATVVAATLGLLEESRPGSIEDYQTLIAAAVAFTGGWLAYSAARAQVSAQHHQIRQAEKQHADRLRLERDRRLDLLFSYCSTASAFVEVVKFIGVVSGKSEEQEVSFRQAATFEVRAPDYAIELAAGMDVFPITVRLAHRLSQLHHFVQTEEAKRADIWAKVDDLEPLLKEMIRMIKEERWGHKGHQ